MDVANTIIYVIYPLISVVSFTFITAPTLKRVEWDIFGLLLFIVIVWIYHMLIGLACYSAALIYFNFIYTSPELQTTCVMLLVVIGLLLTFEKEVSKAR